MKEKINYLLLAATLIIATVLTLKLYINGDRFTEIQAIKASPLVSGDFKTFGQVKRDWGTVYLLDTKNGLKTTLVVKQGLLWHCDADTKIFDDAIKNDKVKTVGLISTSEGNNKQITVLAVQSVDTNVKFIVAGPNSDRKIKNIEPNQTVIFTWDKMININDIKAIALGKNSVQLYRYGFPENTNTINAKDIRWYSVNNLWSN